MVMLIVIYPAWIAQLIARRGDRAVEGARLEIVCTPNKGTGGSNPPLSASFAIARWVQDGNR